MIGCTPFAAAVLAKTPARRTGWPVSVMAAAGMPRVLRQGRDLVGLDGAFAERIGGVGAQVDEACLAHRMSIARGRDEFSMSALTLFGLFAVTAMLVTYALEARSRWFILAFAGACLLGSAYGFLQGAWPFGAVEAIWAVVAAWRFVKHP